MSKIGSDLMRRIGQKDKRLGLPRTSNSKFDGPETEQEYQVILAIVADIEHIGTTMPVKKFIGALQIALNRANRRARL